MDGTDEKMDEIDEIKEEVLSIYDINSDKEDFDKEDTPDFQDEGESKVIIKNLIPEEKDYMDANVLEALKDIKREYVDSDEFDPQNYYNLKGFSVEVKPIPDYYKSFLNADYTTDQDQTEDKDQDPNDTSCSTFLDNGKNHTIIASESIKRQRKSASSPTSATGVDIKRRKVAALDEHEAFKLHHLKDCFVQIERIPEFGQATNKTDKYKTADNVIQFKTEIEEIKTEDLVAKVKIENEFNQVECGNTEENQGSDSDGEMDSQDIENDPIVQQIETESQQDVLKNDPIVQQIETESQQDVLKNDPIVQQIETESQQDVLKNDPIVQQIETESQQDVLKNSNDQNNDCQDKVNNVEEIQILSTTNAIREIEFHNQKNDLDSSKPSTLEIQEYTQQTVVNNIVKEKKGKTKVKDGKLNNTFFPEQKINKPKKNCVSCQLCSFVTKTAFSLRRHVLNIHEKSPTFLCAQCSFKAANKKMLKNHMIVHSGKKYYQCGECEFAHSVFANVKRHQARRHKDTVNSEKRLQQKAPNKSSFPTKGDVIVDSPHKNNQSEHFPETTIVGHAKDSIEVEKENSTVVDEMEEDNGHSASNTGNIYETKNPDGYFDGHMELRIKKEVKTILKVDGSKQERVIKSLEVVFTKEPLEQDPSTADELEKIKKFINLDSFYPDMSKHKRKSNTTTSKKSKPVKCRFCFFRCTYPSQLKTHEFIHTGSTKYVCSICKYKAAGPSILNRHMKVHS